MITTLGNHKPLISMMDDLDPAVGSKVSVYNMLHLNWHFTFTLLYLNKMFNILLWEKYGDLGQNIRKNIQLQNIFTELKMPKQNKIIETKNSQYKIVSKADVRFIIFGHLNDWAANNDDKSRL